MRWEEADRFCKARGMGAQSPHQSFAIQMSGHVPDPIRLEGVDPARVVASGFRCTAVVDRPACDGTVAPAGSPPLADLIEVAGPPGGPRVRTTCPSMPVPRRAEELLGLTYENAAVAMPAGLQMVMEAAVETAGDWSILTAKRGPALIVILAEMLADDGVHFPTREITDALDLGVPCAGLSIEPRTCDRRDRPDPLVLALMDEVYSCGGHGESAPVRAWRIEDRRLVEIDAAEVTCGGTTCEVDPPLGRS
jgi:hypothetical protein